MKLLVDQVNRLKENYHTELENNKKLNEIMRSDDTTYGCFGSKDSNDYASSIIKDQKAVSDRKLKDMDIILNECEIIENPNSNTIEIGSKFIAKIEFVNGYQEKEYVLVESIQSGDPRNYISIASPIGKAILGKTLNEIFTYNTPKDSKGNYNVIRVEIKEIIMEKRLTR